MARVLLIFVVLLTSACASRVPAPRVSPDGPDDPEQAWARVLNDYVDDHGRVDFAGVSARPEDLNTWISHVARVSPRTHPAVFPTVDAQLAYYLDAYNGLALYGVIHSGVVPAQKIRFFLLRKYTLGGEEISLYDLENRVIRPYGEPRVHFALNCMSVGCPRLPRTPWDARRLDRQLEEATRGFFNTDQHVRVDPGERTVYVSQLLDFYEEDFLEAAPSLIDYVNRYREQPIPGDFRVRFIPYDWTLNRQPLDERSDHLDALSD